MNDRECQEALTALREYFPRLGTRLDEAPRVLKDAMFALARYDLDDVLTACRRLSFATLLHPSLDAVLEMADVIREEQRQARARQRPPGEPKPVAKTIDELMREWAATPHDPVDLFWAKEHVRMVRDGTAADPVARAERYWWIAEEGPALRVDCERQIATVHV